jgi:hypothetical protein
MTGGILPGLPAKATSFFGFHEIVTFNPGRPPDPGGVRRQVPFIRRKMDG